MVVTPLIIILNQPFFFVRRPLASGDSPIKIIVDVSVVEGELGMTSVTVELPLTETCAAVKAKLVAMGVRSIPANRMKLQLFEKWLGKSCFCSGENWGILEFNKRLGMEV